MKPLPRETARPLHLSVGHRTAEIESSHMEDVGGSIPAVPALPSTRSPRRPARPVSLNKVMRDFLAKKTPVRRPVITSPEPTVPEIVIVGLNLV